MIWVQKAAGWTLLSSLLFWAPVRRCQGMPGAPSAARGGPWAGGIAAWGHNRPPCALSVGSDLSVPRGCADKVCSGGSISFSTP